MKPRLRILRTPAGAAPERIRQAWVGLELPLQAEQEFIHQSVLDQARTRSRVRLAWWRLTGRVQRARGFAVSVLDALEVLEQHRPQEATWWRTNAAHLCVPGAIFVFDAACGERVDAG